MRIGAFDAVHDVAYGKTGKERASSTTLLNADDAYSRRATDGVVEGRVIASKRDGATQRHKDTIAAGRDIHQVRRWIIAHGTDQTELVHN